MSNFESLIILCPILNVNLNKGTFSRGEVTTWDLADEGQPVTVRVLAMIVLEDRNTDDETYFHKLSLLEYKLSNIKIVR